MAALARASVAVHVVDLPYRFSSWALDELDNIGLWVGPRGGLAAWSVLQTPFWTIDVAVLPEAGPEAWAQVLAWADERARRALDTPYGHPAWFVGVAAKDGAQKQALEAAGYHAVADRGEAAWAQVRLWRAGPPPGAGPLPMGFAIRPLAGEREVAAYVDLHRAVFQSKNMTEPWRARTLRRSEYIPDLDLVAEAPDGRLAAFCVGWLDLAAEPVSGQIEPMGVHADFRKLGLGRALLAEAVRRLHQHGARQVYVQTDDFRDAAFHLYAAAGFEVEQPVAMYRKDFA
jgi:ribosomal protein S18 acetylase RimI-like enzyme